MLKGKKILLGITGSIAAYKSAHLVRMLIKEGAEVRVIMTEAAKDFVTPLTLSVLSKNPVLAEFTDMAKAQWNNHVHLGMWADVFIIAPASANTIAKMANGICDNLLLAVYLSAKCPVYIAPAMDFDMLHHKSTAENLKRLASYGNRIIPPATGELASGLEGEGRMEEPEGIVELLKNAFADDTALLKKKVLVTAGPTYEKIDAVRYIGNRSSGKMGYAIANVFAGKGAQVTLISGPSHLSTINKNIKRITVETADEMYDACLEYFDESDITVMSAAVGDYKPEKSVSGKIKKNSSKSLTRQSFVRRQSALADGVSDGALNLKLVKTKDILADLGKRKKKGQVLVGFALETDNERKNAKEKLKKKNLDFIVLNSLNDEGAGFSTDTNKITIIDRQNNVKEFALKPKTEVAEDIVKEVIKLLG